MRKHTGRKRFDGLAETAARATGHPAAAAVAAALVVLFALSGLVFGFPVRWQLLINTGTTVIIFLMVFVIQQSQKRHSEALHLKLNELIAAHQSASNRLMATEDLNEPELRQLRKFYRKLASLAEQSGSLRQTHSLEEADASHRSKQSSGNVAAFRPGGKVKRR